MTRDSARDGVTRRRVLASVAAVGGGSTLLFESGAYSQVEVDRGLQVATVPAEVDDGLATEDAVLGLRYRTDRTLDCDESLSLVEVGNQTPSALRWVTVTLARVPARVTLTRDGERLTDGDTLVAVDADAGDTPLSPGEAVAVALTATCETPGAAGGPLLFDVRASGPAVSVETTRPRRVAFDCDCRPDSAGEGNRGRERGE
jgi:hypothetical protein